MRQGQPQTTTTKLASVGVGQFQTHLAVGNAKKCRGGFLPRILGWEHSIPYPSPIPRPPRGRKTEGVNHVVFLCSKYLYLALLAPLLNLFFFFCRHVTFWLRLLVNALDFHFILTWLFTAASSSLLPVSPHHVLISACGLCA